MPRHDRENGRAARLLTGNVAKLYCLEWIDKMASERSGELTVLDLGCGSGRNLLELLRRRPGIRYIGVDPLPEACAEAREALRGLNVEIRREPAYDVSVPPVDVVVSFSVLEHVYRRRLYLDSVKRNLAAGGICLINYDAGHFLTPMTRGERLWRRLAHLAIEARARLGDETGYQRFVGESEFRGLACEAGLEIVDDKMFNTDLKSAFKLVPAEHRDEFTTRWYEIEMYLNSVGIGYHDAHAPVFRTRNFALVHAERPLIPPA